MLFNKTKAATRKAAGFVDGPSYEELKEQNKKLKEILCQILNGKRDYDEGISWATDVMRNDIQFDETVHKYRFKNG